MGFDIECIIDIHTYPGEYFCPVCRTLVYPNEALQSQCTHLYCKPCLAHVANGTRACPYDGYLVTEADSKLLIESDKALTENIGKVKVRCLYHRSGCTWEGILSECSSHCSGCTFGNSPVICNRCGIQIVHRQVHDHAQSCPGVYQAPQSVDSVQNAATSGTAPATTAADQNLAAATQPGASISQAQNPPTTAAPHLAGPEATQQPSANSQAASAAPLVATTTEQWYNQQYQQYYQQYAGYDPYQQSYQQYYPYQQPTAQQYQQHPPQLQGQYHSQVYTQAQAQAQAQAQPQAQLQVQQAQAHAQAQAQAQVQPHPPSQQSHTQSQPQTQPKVQTQSQVQAQVPLQGQPQPQLRVQAIAAQYQNQAQVNSQQQFPPPQQPLPQGHPTSQPQPYTHPQPQPYPPMPAYQQPPQQMQPPLASQNNTQPSMQFQPQHPHQPQIQPQPHLQNHPQSYSLSRPPQINQPTVPNTQPQASNQAVPAVTGHQSYQPPQQMPMVPFQQHPMHPHPMTGSLPMHSQIPQQPHLMRPPPSHGPTPNQQQAAVLPHGPPPNNPPAQQQQLYAHGQPPLPPAQQRPGIQPIQQSTTQQPQAFPAPLQGQHGHFLQQQPLQSQLRTQGAPHVMQAGPHGYIPSQQNIPLAPGMVPQQAQNYVGRPLVPTLGVQPQPFSQSPGGFAGATHKPVQPVIQNYANRADIAPEISDKSAQGQGEKDITIHTANSFELKAVKSETGIKNDQESTIETRDRFEKDAEKDAKKDGLTESVTQQSVKEEPTEGSLEVFSVGKSLDASTVEDKNALDVANKELESLSSQKETLVKQKDMSAAPDNDTRVAPSAFNADDCHKNLKPEVSSQSPFMGKGYLQHHGNDASLQNLGHSSYQQKFSDPLMSVSLPPSGPPPRPLAPGYGSAPLRPQGPEYLPLPGQSLNQIEHSQPPLLKQPHDAPFSGFSGPGSTATYGREHGIFGPPPRGFEIHSAAPQGPLLPGVPSGSVDPRSGIMGRAPHHGPEGPPGRAPVIESSTRMHGAAGHDPSALGFQDERFNPPAGTHVNPFPVEPIRPFDQDPGAGVPSRFMPPPHPDVGVERDLPTGFAGDYRGKVDPARAHPDFLRPDQGFGRLTPRSPDHNYIGMPPRGPRSFGEGPRSFNLPPDPVGNSFHENRFPEPGHLNSHSRSNDPFEQDIFSGHLRRGEMLGPRDFPGHYGAGDPAGFGAFPGRGRMEEFGGSFPHRLPGGESFRGNMSNRPRIGEPGFRSGYSLQGFPNDGRYAGDLDPFGKSRKRKPVSMGWCRICKVDCESVEGLDMHSQTREHQRMAMDMVKSIKQQNRKKNKSSGEHAALVDTNKGRNSAFEGRGSKP